MEAYEAIDMAAEPPEAYTARQWHACAAALVREVERLRDLIEEFADDAARILNTKRASA